MQIKNTYYILLILVLSSCSPQGKKMLYSDQKGKYEIEFPGKPVIKAEQQQFQFGTLTWTSASVDKPDKYNLSYLVKYTDFPTQIINSDSLDRIQDFLVFTQTDFLQSLGETALENIYIRQVQKYPGREFRWFDAAKNTGYTRRVFLVKNRVYFLEVKYKKEDDFNIDIEGFLDKFTLLNTADNKNPEVEVDKPEVKFEMNFPGKTILRDNPSFHGLFGKIHGILMAHEVPREEADLPTTSNLLYGINYVKLPSNIVDSISTTELRAFVIDALYANMDIMPAAIPGNQREIETDGYWGVEGTGRMKSGFARMHIRSYIVDDYYYQLIVLSKNGMENNREALDFLNSFKLID